MGGVVSDLRLDVPELPLCAQEIEDPAHRLRVRGGEVAPDTQELVAVWRELRSHYDAPEAEELIERMTALAAGGAQTSEALSRVGDVLSELADALRVVESRRAAAMEAVMARGAPVSAATAAEVDLTVSRLRSDVAGVLDEACRGLGGIADPPSLNLATSPGIEPFIGPRISWRMRTEEAARDILFAPLIEAARGGAGRVRALLADHLEWAERIRQRPPAPGAVRDWWDTLTPAARTALTTGAPAVVGALGGVPPLARVAAHRVVARDRIPVIEQEIARYRSLLAEGSLATLRADRQSAIDRLVVERAYLGRVVAGDVQLVLYEPEQNRIAEMIGTPGPGTERVLTYVPGTFTSVESFYGGVLQDLPQWLARQDEGTLAFVWKGAEFPGDDDSVGLADQVAGIMEANEERRALGAGESLARFAAEMRSDPQVAAARHVAAGYSWGLVPVTSSELAGAHFDSVHSFAGAWVPDGWNVADGTTYYHWSYTDFLSIAQDAGLVGQGRNPDLMPGIQRRIYDRRGDYDVPLGGELAPCVDPDGPSMRISSTPFDNHQLIVSDRPENRLALDDIRDAFLEKKQ